MPEPSLMHPDAVWSPIAGFDGLRPFTGSARKLVLHTTETSGWPSYSGGGVPHFTADFDTGHIRQHLPLDVAAYTLKGGDQSPNSAAGVVVQVEIIGFAKDSPTRSDAWYRRLRRFVDWSRVALDIPTRFPFPFGVSSTAHRQAWETWRDTSGVVGHQHAPFNDHWDPGAVDVARLAGDPWDDDLAAVNRRVSVVADRVKALTGRADQADAALAALLAQVDAVERGNTRLGRRVTVAAQQVDILTGSVAALGEQADKDRARLVAVERVLLAQRALCQALEALEASQ